MMVTQVGKEWAWRSLLMSEALVMDIPLVVRNPLSCQMVEWEWAIRKAYFESMKKLTRLPLASINSLSRA